MVAWMSLLFLAKYPCSRAIGGAQGPSLLFDGWSESVSSSVDDPSLSSGFGEERPIRNGAGVLATRQVVFGIAGSLQLWMMQKEFIKLRWRRDREMHGFLWLEEPVEEEVDRSQANLPKVMVSEDTSRFSYTHSLGHPSGIQISRLVSEKFRINLHDVKWFVMGDDDTMFNVENLVHVLSKYDPSEMWYIGNPSESHHQNDHFSSNMAFGGGGFAMSYSLAAEVAKMQDNCLERLSAYHQMIPLAALRKERDSIVKKKKVVDSAMEAVDMEIETFHKEVQFLMNDIEMLLSLRMSQIEYLEDGGLPSYLSKGLVFDNLVFPLNPGLNREIEMFGINDVYS